MEWRDIVGYEGIYVIREDGAIRSHDRVIKTNNQYGICFKNVKGRDMQPTIDKLGYYRISLVDINGKRTTHKIYRLVALAFIDGYFEGAEINHIDYNRANNHYSNLEWVTHTENIKHSYCNRPTVELKGERKPLSAFCRDYNIGLTTVRYRMLKLGMSLEEALTTPKLRLQ